MNVLHPWSIYAGAAAIALPLAIHFLTRPRPQAHGAIDLSICAHGGSAEAGAPSAARDFLGLAVAHGGHRVCGPGAGAAVVGRSFCGSRCFRRAGVRVVLLDVSESMKQIDGGTQVFQRAKSIAGDYLNFHPDTQVGLIFAGGRPETPLNQPSTNFELLRDELTKSSVQSVRCNVQTALARAGEMLAPSFGRRSSAS